MKLKPISYELPAPWDWIEVDYCSGFAPFGIAKEHHKPPYWYIYRRDKKPYYRDGEGWFEHTPTQFRSPQSAAKAFIVWANKNQEEAVA